MTVPAGVNIAHSVYSQIYRDMIEHKLVLLVKIEQNFSQLPETNFSEDTFFDFLRSIFLLEFVSQKEFASAIRVELVQVRSWIRSPYPPDLAAVLYNPRVYKKYIAAALGMSKRNATRILSRLENSIASNNSPTD